MTSNSVTIMTRLSLNDQVYSINQGYFRVFCPLLHKTIFYVFLYWSYSTNNYAWPRVTTAQDPLQTIIDNGEMIQPLTFSNNSLSTAHFSGLSVCAGNCSLRRIDVYRGTTKLAATSISVTQYKWDHCSRRTHLHTYSIKIEITCNINITPCVGLHPSV